MYQWQNTKPPGDCSPHARCSRNRLSHWHTFKSILFSFRAHRSYSRMMVSLLLLHCPLLCLRNLFVKFRSFFVRATHKSFLFSGHCFLITNLFLRFSFHSLAAHRTIVTPNSIFSTFPRSNVKVFYFLIYDCIKSCFFLLFITSCASCT